MGQYLEPHGSRGSGPYCDCKHKASDVELALTSGKHSSLTARPRRFFRTYDRHLIRTKRERIGPAVHRAFNKQNSIGLADTSVSGKSARGDLPPALAVGAQLYPGGGHERILGRDDVIDKQRPPVGVPGSGGRVFSRSREVSEVESVCRILDTLAGHERKFPGDEFKFSQFLPGGGVPRPGIGSRGAQKGIGGYPVFVAGGEKL